MMTVPIRVCGAGNMSMVMTVPAGMAAAATAGGELGGSVTASAGRCSGGDRLGDDGARGPARPAPRCPATRAAAL